MQFPIYSKDFSLSRNLKRLAFCAPLILATQFTACSQSSGPVPVNSQLLELLNQNELQYLKIQGSWNCETLEKLTQDRSPTQSEATETGLGALKPFHFYPEIKPLLDVVGPKTSLVIWDPSGCILSLDLELKFLEKNQMQLSYSEGIVEFSHKVCSQTNGSSDEDTSNLVKQLLPENRYTFTLMRAPSEALILTNESGYRYSCKKTEETKSTLFKRYGEKVTESLPRMQALTGRPAAFHLHDNISLTVDRLQGWLNANHP